MFLFVYKLSHFVVYFLYSVGKLRQNLWIHKLSKKLYIKKLKAVSTVFTKTSKQPLATKMSISTKENFYRFEEKIKCQKKISQAFWNAHTSFIIKKSIQTSRLIIVDKLVLLHHLNFHHLIGDLKNNISI